jgi:hypothetical protein
MESYDNKQQDLNLQEVLQGESQAKNSQNLQAVTLYIYNQTFLVIENSKSNDDSLNQIKELKSPKDL